jgi:hypothetical protein
MKGGNYRKVSKKFQKPGLDDKSSRDLHNNTTDKDFMGMLGMEREVKVPYL